jgi:transposase
LRTQIQFLSQHGVKSKIIAERLNVNIKTVHKWMKRTTIFDSKQPGRPPVLLSPNTKATITSLCKDQWCASIRKTAKILNLSEAYQQRGKTISATTVRNFIRSTEWGRIAYSAKKAPMLTNRNVQDRRLFAGMIFNHGYCQGDAHAAQLLDHILFTDESLLELYPKPNAQNTRIRSSNLDLRKPIQIPKNGLKVMIAGGLSANGLTTLHICPPNTTITGNYYREHILPLYFDAKAGSSANGIIAQKLFEHPENVAFMQDGAPAHTAKLTMNLIEQNFGIIWSKNVWPGNSPDLNPIEHLWYDLQQSVFVEPRPTNREELVSRIQETWKAFSQEHTKRLVYSFPKRIQQCLDRRGQSTDY